MGSQLKDVSDLEGVKNSDLIDLLLRCGFLLYYQCDSKKPFAIIHAHSINQSITYVMMSIVASQQSKGLSRKKHSEFHVEDSGNIRNRHAMPNFKGKGRMYDETNK